jgi:hypothetical protein
MRKALGLLLLISLPLPALAQLQSTIAPPTLPNLGTDHGGTSDADAVICRSPQQLQGQRIYGPRVCKPQRQWDDLHRQGLDVGPDGDSVVASEKYRTMHGCNSGAAC